jgi:hypothetical protein
MPRGPFLPVPADAEPAERGVREVLPGAVHVHAARLEPLGEPVDQGQVR